jgi:putative ABC transport system permease protein
MAIGIGATTAVFSVFDAVLLRPVPFAHPNELVELWTRDDDGSAYPRLDRERAEVWTTQSALFAGVERYVDMSMLLGSVDEPENLRATYISTGLLPLLGVTPASGRGFTADDARSDAPAVALVSGAFWRQHLTSRPIGKPVTIRLDDQVVHVVGVMPDWFRYPRGIVSVWLPLRDLPGAPAQQFNYLARLQPGITEPVARARFDEYTRRLTAASPRKEGWGVSPMFVSAAQLNKDDRTGLFVLVGAAACVMLVACVNAANLLLAQATVRRRELGIRAALGATRRNLVAQLLAESFVLATIGAIIGVGLSYWAVDFILLILPKDLSVFGNADVGIDARVLAFAVVTSFATWLLCGAGPALHASRARGSLVSGDRTDTGSRGMRRVRGGLAIAELAVSLVLICGAGVFMRSLANLSAVDPGFDTAHVLAADIGVSVVRYPTPEQRAQYLDDIEREVRALPGVRGVSFATGLPPQAGITFGKLEAEGVPVMKSGESVIPFAEVDTGFFTTVGVPVLRGRSFNGEDAGSKERTAVVNTKLAAALWPSLDPLGRRFRLDPARPWITVVGVVGDMKLMGPDDRQVPFGIYFPRPRLGRATRSLSMAVRTDRDPSTLAVAVKRAIRRVNPDQPIRRLAPAADLFAESMSKARFTLVLLSAFAAIGLGLAVAGTYSVLSYSVVQRRREIGIRMALGAEPRDIVRELLGDGLILAAAGMIIGLIGVSLTSRLTGALLFGVAPRDPLVLISMSIVLLVASILATLIPASRASRVSPLIAITPE